MALCCLLTILAAAPGCSDSSSGGGGASVKLQGAGASFPAPLYNKWFKAYTAAHPGRKSTISRSAAARRQSVIDKTVDFGASDAAMTPEEISKSKAACRCCR